MAATPPIPLHLEISHGIADLRLNRPPMNPVNDDLLVQLDHALATIEQERVIAVRVRGNDRALSAGADLKLVAERVGSESGADAMRETSKLFQRVYQRLEHLSALTVAEIGGLALGGGLELALACDLRIVAECATLGLPEVKVGLLPGAGGTQRLTRLCGRSVAARMILTGELLSGREAYRVGLADYLVASPADLARQVEEIMTRAASYSWDAIRQSKICINAAAYIDGFGYDHESDGIRSLMLTDDAVTRVGQFVATRPANA